MNGFAMGTKKLLQSTSCDAQIKMQKNTALHWDETDKTHPCFFRTAHLKHARMHLAVAPKCNIQCNYCDRNYDCPNESRPGVASECITPQEALQYVKAAYKKIPQLNVVGIAGPGDPLANPKKTFKTFELISKEFPELKLCFSTNGLNLLDYLDEIIKLNIKYVTITINAVDPRIGKKIYAWVRYNGALFRGEEAAAILWGRQQSAIQLLAELGIMVKVNTVLISGVNDQHIVDIARKVKKIGAALFNLVPLIPLPNTPFANYPRPSLSECNALRKVCGSYIRVMYHCRQCRADAVGFLHNSVPENRGLRCVSTGDFSKEKNSPVRKAVKNDR